jgi:hypothetical protein
VDTITRECPTCGSPKPELHPAMQVEGEVQPCSDPWHMHASSESAPPSYRYRDAALKVIWQTSVPKDDESALAYFHSVVRFGPGFKPVYCERIERGEGITGEKYVMLTEVFDPEAMETKPFGIGDL